MSCELSTRIEQHQRKERRRGKILFWRRMQLNLERKQFFGGRRSHERVPDILKEETSSWRHFIFFRSLGITIATCKDATPTGRPYEQTRGDGEILSQVNKINGPLQQTAMCGVCGADRTGFFCFSQTADLKTSELDPFETHDRRVRQREHHSPPTAALQPASREKILIIGWGRACRCEGYPWFDVCLSPCSGVDDSGAASSPAYDDRAAEDTIGLYG